MNRWMQMFDLTGKSAVVTGASYGLGVTLAETLAAAGARVALAARSLDKLEAVAAKLREQGYEASAYSCDVGSPTQVAATMETVSRDFGRIDILVNNAGIAVDAGPVPEKVPHELFEQTFRVNLFGVWYCCREAGARMLADGKGGSIINVASISGLAGWGDHPPAYQSSKAAVINLTRNLAVSWANRGVRVNAIAPGWFPSEMTGPTLEVEDFAQYIADNTPMGRLGKVEELAGPVLFLASAASSFVTGHVLVADGGFSAGSGAFSAPESYRKLREVALPHGLGKPIGWEEEE